MTDRNRRAARASSRRHSGAQRQRGQAASHASHGTSEDAGWVLFAGMLLVMAGILNIIYGIAAIESSRFFAGHAAYVIGDLETWGWITAVIGGLQFIAALGVWAEQGWARWGGVGVAGLSAVTQLVSIAGYPLLSLAIVALDVLVIWGLVAHGGRSQGR